MSEKWFAVCVSINLPSDSILLPDSTIFPQSPSYQRHLKTRKNGVYQPFQWTPPNLNNPNRKLRFLFILSHSSTLLPASTKNPMALFLNCRLCRCEIMMTFTPGVNDLPLLPHLCGIYPTLFCDSTNRQINPLPLCGIRYKMISAERSAAFDRCGGICYNKSTKGNTANRRSALRNWFLKK